MIITNYNFNNYPGKQLRFVFDDYPIKLVNPYKFRELLTNEEGQYLDKAIRKKKFQDVETVFRMKEDIIRKVGMEKCWLVVYSNTRIPQDKYITPKFLANNLDYSTLIAIDKNHVKKERDKLCNEESFKRYIQPVLDQIPGYTLKQIKKIVWKGLLSTLVLPSAWDLDIRSNPPFYIGGESRNINFLRFYLTMYVNNGKPLLVI